MSTYSDHTRSRGLSTVFTVAGQVRAYLSSAIVLALVAGWLLSLAPLAYAQEPNQIGLVIHHGDGSATTRCVEFSEPQLSGYDVLQRSQLEFSVDASGMGSAICRIDGEGCTTPQEDCFCGMNQNPPVYWSYWQVVDRQWRYSNLGASMSLVQPGAVEGWVWGPGNVDETAPLPIYSLEQICAPAPATPTATHTALPTLTFTPEPTATLPPAATDTPWPTNTPTETPTEMPSIMRESTDTPIPTFTPTWTPTWTPSATPEPSMTPLPTLTWTPVSPTEMPSAESVAMTAQPEAPVSYGLRLPVVQAPVPPVSVAASAEVALPVTEIEPTAPLLPTATATPEVVAIVATEPPPTPAPEVVPDVVTVVVTPPPVVTIVVVEEVAEVATVAEVAIAPTLLPAAAPPAPAPDTQLTMLLGMIAAAGMLVALPMGLVVVAVVAYWIGRRL